MCRSEVKGVLWTFQFECKNYSNGRERFNKIIRSHYGVLLSTAQETWNKFAGRKSRTSIDTTIFIHWEFAGIIPLWMAMTCWSRSFEFVFFSLSPLEHSISSSKLLSCTFSVLTIFRQHLHKSNDHWLESSRLNKFWEPENPAKRGFLFPGAPSFPKRVLIGPAPITCPFSEPITGAKNM